MNEKCHENVSQLCTIIDFWVHVEHIEEWKKKCTSYRATHTYLKISMHYKMRTSAPKCCLQAMLHDYILYIYIYIYCHVKPIPWSQFFDNVGFWTKPWSTQKMKWLLFFSSHKYTLTFFLSHTKNLLPFLTKMTIFNVNQCFVQKPNLSTNWDHALTWQNNLRPSFFTVVPNSFTTHYPYNYLRWLR